MTTPRSCACVIITDDTFIRCASSNQTALFGINKLQFNSFMGSKPDFTQYVFCHMKVIYVIWIPCHQIDDKFFFIIIVI